MRHLLKRFLSPEELAEAREVAEGIEEEHPLATDYMLRLIREVKMHRGDSVLDRQP